MADLDIYWWDLENSAYILTIKSYGVLLKYKLY
jgi:hypothetical protein